MHTLYLVVSAIDSKAPALLRARPPLGCWSVVGRACPFVYVQRVLVCAARIDVTLTPTRPDRAHRIDQEGSLFRFSRTMSIELLEDGVLVEPEEAQEQPTTSDITTDDSDSTTDKAEQEAGEEQHTENDGAAAVSSSLTSPPAASSSSSSLSAAAVARAVDAAESATDQPKVSDSKLDELSVRLPHLPSPFDAIYPRSRGGDRWNKICADGHCMMSELEPGDGKGNVPVLNRVYGQHKAAHEKTNENKDAFQMCHACFRSHAICLCLFFLSVNVEGRLQDGTVFLNFPVEELDFTLGQGPALSKQSCRE